MFGAASHRGTGINLVATTTSCGDSGVTSAVAVGIGLGHLPAVDHVNRLLTRVHVVHVVHVGMSTTCTHACEAEQKCQLQEGPGDIA